MVVSEKHLRIAARREQIAMAVDFVAHQAQLAGLDDDGIHQCSLAVDEACSNIVEHGYKAGTEQAIELTCREEDAAFSILIADHAPAYNPLNQPEPDPATPLDQRVDGGWGVSFMRRLMDDVAYQHHNGRNILVLTKYLDATRKRIGVKQQDRHLFLVAPMGDLDERFSQRLALALGGEIAAGHKYLIMDLSGVDLVTSGGLKMLVSVWQRAREQKGDIVLAGLNTAVQEVMNLTGFDLVFSIYPTVAEAANLHKFR